MATPRGARISGPDRPAQPDVIICGLDDPFISTLLYPVELTEVPLIVLAGEDASVADRAHALSVGIDSLMDETVDVSEIVARVDYLISAASNAHRARR